MDKNDKLKNSEKLVYAFDFSRTLLFSSIFGFVVSVALIYKGFITANRYYYEDQGILLIVLGFVLALIVFIELWYRKNNRLEIYEGYVKGKGSLSSMIFLNFKVSFFQMTFDEIVNVEKCSGGMLSIATADREVFVYIRDREKAYQILKEIM